MINKTEFEVLDILSKGQEIDQTKYINELKSLLNEGLIEPNSPRQYFNKVFHHGFLITPKGQRAYEEYKNFIESEKRNNETLDLSKKAIQKSRNANIIAIVALVASSVFSILALVFTLIANFIN